MSELVLPIGVFLISGLLLMLGLLRNPAGDPFEMKERRSSTSRQLERRLRRAGLLGTTPGFALVLAGGTTAMIWLVATLLTASPYPGLAAVVIVPLGGWFFLTFRERGYVKRASSELVPFLRKIESQIRAGRLPQAAYAQAVSESVHLRPALEQSLAELRLSRPFIEVLRESMARLPLRSWEQFVRQLEIHSETGGDLAEIISDAVKQIDQLIRLQARMRAEYATFAKQQMVLVAVAIAVFPGLHLMGLLGELTGTLTGWGAIGVALLMMGAGIFYGQRSLRDIERRLEF
ncbi:type II secretion system F family protein [Miltoncostaea oceani]|uniref:type II secretion system F family protein n=1 Tax=Miltoncostaea oceani TaxID=2843216 RepID=UPI001C3E743D|nr:hypothetical protein [Miltoncostaea oceani]